MANKSKKLLLALLLSCSVALLATGCDKLKKAPETESETQTETQSETQTETETQSETQTETESETQTETESETQPKELTPEEEKAQQKELDQLRTLYAKDDINVRTEPDTSSDENIIYAYWQGDQLTAVGETPNWYVVSLEDYESDGYVSKKFVSEEKVEPKTEEERQKLYEQEGGETTPEDGSSSTSGSADTGSSSVDLEFNVQSYAEEFPVIASTGANMRTSPAQDGEIIDTIASGTSVTAIGYTDRWYKVSYNGNVGYVNKNLFSAE